MESLFAQSGDACGSCAATALVNIELDFLDFLRHRRVVACDPTLNALASQIHRLGQLDRDRTLHFTGNETENTLIHSRDDSLSEGLVLIDFVRNVLDKKLP